MKCTSVCTLLRAVFVALCLLPSLTTTKTVDDGIMEADSDLQTRHRSKRDSHLHCITDSCAGKPNGNYPTCSSDCKDGYYFACSNGYIYKMQCPLGWYTYVNGTRYTAPMVYLPETDSCQLEANYCQGRDNSESGRESSSCVNKSCEGKPNGNYSSCTGDCKDGYFFTCSNGLLYKQQCPLGWYNSADGSRYTAPLVYIPELDRCELEPNYCQGDVHPVSTSPPLDHAI